MHTSTGYRVGSKSSENPTAKIGVRCSPHPGPLQPAWVNELLLRSTGKTTLSNQNPWEQRTMPSGSFWESQRPCWHCRPGRAAHSPFPTHSWAISNHNCEWHPAAPFWDRVPLKELPVLCLEAAELQLKPDPPASERVFHEGLVNKFFNRMKLGFQSTVSIPSCIFQRKPGKDGQG